jgi:hypothetical protein
MRTFPVSSENRARNGQRFCLSACQNPLEKLLMTKNGCFMLLAALALVSLITGCGRPPQQAYYVSPFNGNNTEYHALPRQGDSIHAALYGSMVFFKGTANNNNVDDFWGMHSSLYAAHQYTHVQFYYGASLTLGSYDMGHWPYSPSVPSIYTFNNAYYANPDQLNLYAGSHSFGGVGFQGGINGVIPIGIGEWRLLGVETSITHEFGDYLSVRQQMPDSIATLINRNSLFATIGVNSELVAHVRDGEFGFKWTYGVALGHNYSNPGVFDNQTDATLHYYYFNFSFHYTYQRVTGFVQVMEATKASGGMVGIDYRLAPGARR